MTYAIPQEKFIILQCKSIRISIQLSIFDIVLYWIIIRLKNIVSTVNIEFFSISSKKISLKIVNM